MSHDVSRLALVGAVAALVTLATVPLARWLAFRFGMVVEPSERRIHQRPTPTLGGLAMFLGVVAAFGVTVVFPGFEPIRASPSNLIGVATAAALMFAVGLIDDLRDVSPPAKLAGMVLSGSVLALAGVSILNVPLPFVGFTVLSADLAALATVLWVVVMANAVNLIDGLDGLAAGIVAIAAFAFLLYGVKLGRVGVLDSGNVGPLVAVIVVGVCVGFLPWNFHPAKIFMGDSGALMLGLLMAASTISVGGQTDNSYTGQSWFFFAPLVIPLVILGVPLVDMVFAVIRRARNRSGVAVRDIGHLHHRLLRLGHSQRRSVLILWAFTALLSAFALYPVLTNKGEGLLPIALIGVVLLLFTMLAPWVDRRR